MPLVTGSFRQVLEAMPAVCTLAQRGGSPITSPTWDKRIVARKRSAETHSENKLVQLVELWVKENNCTIFDVCPSVIGTDKRIAEGEFNHDCIEEFLRHYKFQGKEQGMIAINIAGYAGGCWQGSKEGCETKRSGLQKREK